jgi:hypothetical protein
MIYEVNGQVKGAGEGLRAVAKLTISGVHPIKYPV